VSAWPDGWSIERVRAVAQGDAEEIPGDTAFVVVQVGSGADSSNDYERVMPQLVLVFGTYALVLPVGEEEWMMGMFDPSDSSIACWGTVGEDLEQAILGL